MGLLQYTLFGFDCHHPTEAATLPTKSPSAVQVSDYREELVLNLFSATAIAAKSIARAQQVQRDQYNRHANTTKFKVGDWILIHFPLQEETGQQWKLSRLWHESYRIFSCDNPDVTAVKIFFPTDPPIQVQILYINPKSINAHHLSQAIFTGMVVEDQSLEDEVRKLPDR